MTNRQLQSQLTEFLLLHPEHLDTEVEVLDYDRHEVFLLQRYGDSGLLIINDGPDEDPT